MSYERIDKSMNDISIKSTNNKEYKNKELNIYLDYKEIICKLNRWNFWGKGIYAIKIKK